jgi:hypothetical protein
MGGIGEGKKWIIIIWIWVWVRVDLSIPSPVASPVAGLSRTSERRLAPNATTTIPSTQPTNKALRPFPAFPHHFSRPVPPRPPPTATSHRLARPPPRLLQISSSPLQTSTPSAQRGSSANPTRAPLRARARVYKSYPHRSPHPPRTPPPCCASAPRAMIWSPATGSVGEAAALLWIWGDLSPAESSGEEVQYLRRTEWRSSAPSRPDRCARARPAEFHALLCSPPRFVFASLTSVVTEI